MGSGRAEFGFPRLRLRLGETNSLGMASDHTRVCFVPTCLLCQLLFRAIVDPTLSGIAYSAMIPEEKRRFLWLCQQIRAEQDQKKVSELITELNELLARTEKLAIQPKSAVSA